MPRKVKNDITGQRFGRLTAVQFIPDDTDYAKFLCVCDCGGEKIVAVQSLIRGLTASCGCIQKEARHLKKHGHSGSSRSKTYNSWAGMMDRCEWGGHPSYHIS